MRSSTLFKWIATDIEIFSKRFVWTISREIPSGTFEDIFQAIFGENFQISNRRIFKRILERISEFEQKLLDEPKELSKDFLKNPWKNSEGSSEGFYKEVPAKIPE